MDETAKAFDAAREAIVSDRSERAIASAMRNCVHFNGLLGGRAIGASGEPQCRAGVPYATVKDESRTGLERWPCFGESPCRTCDQRHIRTREEAVAHLDEMAAREAAIPRDPELGCKYEVDAQGNKTALVHQHGYGCHHGEMRPSHAELKAAGYHSYRIVVFTDSGDRCPACKANRGSRR